MHTPTVIYKYKLEPGLERSVPYGIVLAVAEQYGELQVWVQHNEDQMPFGKMMTLFAVGTGRRFDTLGAIHRGTSVGSPYVWHVFERI